MLYLFNLALSDLLEALLCVDEKWNFLLESSLACGLNLNSHFQLIVDFCLLLNHQLIRFLDLAMSLPENIYSVLELFLPSDEQWSFLTEFSLCRLSLPQTLENALIASIEALLVRDKLRLAHRKQALVSADEILEKLRRDVDKVTRFLQVPNR